MPEAAQLDSNVVQLDQMPVAPPSWTQLAVIVADGSGSMTEDLKEPDASLDGIVPVRSKAVAVDVAMRELINRLASGSRAANFHLGYVAFNDGVSEERAPRELLSVVASESFDPTAAGTGGTEISTGIDAAAEMVHAFQEQATDGVPISAVVLVLSDGEDHHPERTMEAAARLKEISNASLAACLFSTKNAEPKGAQLLQAIVSEPRLYQTVFTAQQLRDFFHASITMTALPGAED